MINIIFKKIRMKNFLCHEDMEFAFTPNRFVSITGKNGVGKTAIFDALLWCLYDTTTRGITGDKIIRKRAKKNCYVELEFSIGEDEYIIKCYRKHYKFSNEKILIKNGVDITESLRRLTNKKIADIIMEPEVFMNSLLFSQYIGSDRGFVEMNHTNQKTILDKMLSLDRYDDYYDKISDRIKEIDSEIVNKQHDKDNINGIKDSNHNILIDYELHLSELDEHHDDTKRLILDELETHRLTIEEGRRYIDTHLLYYEKRSELGEALVVIKHAAEKISEEKQTKKNDLLREKESRIDSIRSELYRSYMNKKDSLTQKVHELENQLLELYTIYEVEKSSMDSKYSRQRESILQLTTEKVNEFNSVLTNQREVISKCNNRIESIGLYLNDKIEKLSQYKNSKCPECGQSLKDMDDTSSRISQLEKEISELKRELSENEDNAANASSILRDYQKEKNDWEEKSVNNLSFFKTERQEAAELLTSKYKEDKRARESEVGPLRLELVDMENKYNEDLELEIEKINREFEVKISDSLIKYNRELKDKLEEIGEIEYDYNDMKEKCEKLDEIKMDLSTSITQVENRERNLGEYESQYRDNKETFNRNISKIKISLDEGDEQIEELDKNISSLEEETKILEFWKTAFSNMGIKSLLLDEAIPILNSKSLELSRLTENIRVSFDSQTTLKSGEHRDKFSINVIHTQNLSELGELSAGESRLTSIIVLLSLRHLLEVMNGTSINILLLDEILDGLDIDNVTVALNMLRRLSKKRCVVLISHTLRDNIEADDYLPM